MMATCAARKAAGMSSAMADQPHFVREPVTGDERDQLLAIGRFARRVAGEDDHRVIERALAGKSRRGLDGLAVAFQAREPRRLQHDLGFRRTPQRSRSFATGPGGTTSGSNAASSTPR